MVVFIFGWLLHNIAEDFTTAGKKCATKGVFNEQWGLDCYVELGNHNTQCLVRRTCWLVIQLLTVRLLLTLLLFFDRFIFRMCEDMEL